MKIMLCLCAWLALYVWTVGALMADSRHDLDFIGESPANRLRWEKNRYREKLAFCFGISLLPPTLPMSPFITGFYEHGWVILPPRIEEWTK